VAQEERVVLVLLKVAQETLAAVLLVALMPTAQTLIITILVVMVAVEGLHP
jgi:hypothetical protein